MSKRLPLVVVVRNLTLFKHLARMRKKLMAQLSLKILGRCFLSS